MGRKIRIENALNILKSTQSTSIEFHLPGKLCYIALTLHVGGTWVLEQSFDHGESWHEFKGEESDKTLTWESKATLPLFGSPMLRYRLTGGDVGAIAWAYVAELMDSEDSNFFRESTPR